jgi:hypothetical protein
MTEEELLKERAKTEWVRTIYMWKSARVKDYEPTKENDDKIAAYFKAHQLELTYANLEKAFVELKKQGESFKAKKELPDLPETPKGVPLVHSMSDVNSLSPEEYKRAYFGPHQIQFRARVNEIIRRAKAENEEE